MTVRITYTRDCFSLPAFLDMTGCPSVKAAKSMFISECPELRFVSAKEI